MDLQVVQGINDDMDKLKVKYDNISLKIDEGTITLYFKQNGTIIKKQEFFVRFRMGGVIELVDMLGYITIRSL